MYKPNNVFFKAGLHPCLLLILLMNHVDAEWRINWELGAEIEYSDNNQRTETNEDESIVIEPRGKINAVHDGPHFDAEIGAANEYRSFIDGDQGSNNNFDLDAMLNWKIVPGLFEWSFADHFNSEFPIDIRSSPNESNKQDINSFSTGPSFTPRLFDLTNMIIEGKYIRTDSEESDIDSDRIQGRIGIERLLSSVSTISINYQYEDTDFDESTINLRDANIDFDRDNYFIAYTYLKPSLSISAQLGYTEIDRDQGEDKNSNGNNSQLSLNYILNSTSSISLTAYDQFNDTISDASGGVGLDGGFGNVGGGGSTGLPVGVNIGDVGVDVSGDTVDSKGFLVAYNKQLSGLGARFQYFQREDDHDIVDLSDRDTNGGAIDFSLPVYNTLLVSLIGSYRTTDFDIGDREDDDLLVELRGEYFARQNLRFTSSIEYQDRDSTIEGEGFEEIQLRVGLSYTNF